MSILVKFSKNFDFGQNLRKIPIFSKISKQYQLSQIIEKFRFWSNFQKKFRFWSKFSKIFELFENLEKFRFG